MEGPDELYGMRVCLCVIMGVDVSAAKDVSDVLVSPPPRNVFHTVRARTLISHIICSMLVLLTRSLL